MIADLTPYAAYKNSGQRWLGDVPFHWDARPLCRVAVLKSECGRPDLELLSVYLNRGVIRYTDSGGQVHKPSLDLSKYQVVESGDFVLNNQQAWRGSIGVSKFNGIISPAYVVLGLSSRLNADYANYLFRSPALVAQYVIASRGVGDIQRNLYYPDLRNSIAVIPPTGEQAAIVRFLDWADGRLERAIRAKRKVIALLNEQKQAIIHRAVTRGLDPTVALKPSGVPWLGEIPLHWGMLRSKYIYREVDNRSADGQETHLSMSQKFGLIPSSQLTEKRLVSDSYAGAKLCERGDLVLNRLKAHLGVFALARQPGLVSPDYTVFRPVRTLEERYFEAVYRTPACRVELRKRAKGIVQGFWRLYTDDFYDIPLPVPPLEEQRSIMAQLDIELIGVRTAISRLEREIELLREYRVRLVADVVTGKLDVHQAALLLPDEAPPDTTDDDADIGDESEAADEEVAS